MQISTRAKKFFIHDTCLIVLVPGKTIPSPTQLHREEAMHWNLA